MRMLQEMAALKEQLLQAKAEADKQQTANGAAATQVVHLFVSCWRTWVLSHHYMHGKICDLLALFGGRLCEFERH
jgi:hypothetical protein